MARVLCSALSLAIIAFSPGRGGNPVPPAVTRLVEITWRSSLLVGGTAVLQIRNKSGKKTLRIMLHFRSQDSGATLTHSVGILDPHQTVEVGVLETGWMIEPNEVVTVHAPGYSSKSFYFYRDAKGDLTMACGYAAKKANQIGEAVHKALK